MCRVTVHVNIGDLLLNPFDDGHVLLVFILSRLINPAVRSIPLGIKLIIGSKIVLKIVVLDQSNLGPCFLTNRDSFSVNQLLLLTIDKRVGGTQIQDEDKVDDQND